MADTVTCPGCGKTVALTKAGRYRAHGACDKGGKLAEGAQLPPEQPEQTLAEATEAIIARVQADIKAINEDPVRAFTHPVEALGHDDTSDATPVEGETVQAPATVPLAIDTPPDGIAHLRRMTAYSQPDKPLLPDVGGYEQPGRTVKAVTQQIPMSTFDAQVSAMFKEIFYQYTHDRNRNRTKTTVGPSSAGSPCDRRVLMTLMGMPSVNPGGDGWAAFRGTAVHKALEEMMVWADAKAGRFATEMKLQFGHSLMPIGFADLLDRALFMVVDHKIQGQWSLDKLKTQGMPELYRTQLHLYGYGARQRGEKVERVGLIGWPGDKSSLDDLYVLSEPYDPGIARRAMDRLDALKRRIDEGDAAGVSRLEIAQSTAIADDCKFCNFHMSDARDLTYGGCNGRR